MSDVGADSERNYYRLLDIGNYCSPDWDCYLSFYEERTMKIEKVLVTGAGGFVGGRLCDTLLRCGVYVVAVDTKPRHNWRIQEILTSRGKLDAIGGLVVQEMGGLIRGGLDCIFHLAARARIQPSFADPTSYVESNVLGTANLLRLAREKSVPVVYAGSSTADDDVLLNPYALTKRQGEDFCRLYHRCFNLPMAIARFYNVYGPGQYEEGEDATLIGIFEKQLREGEKFTVTGNGEQRRDFCHVEDIVNGLIAIAEHIDATTNGNTYSLGAGRPYSIKDVALAFAQGNKGRIEYLNARPGEAEMTYANYTPTTVDTGWIPQRRLSDYIRGVVHRHAQLATQKDT